MLQIKKVTKTENIIELETPAYFKSYGTQIILIGEKELIKVSESYLSIWSPEDRYFDETVSETLERNEPATKEDFDKAMDSFMLKVSPFIPINEPSHV